MDTMLGKDYPEVALVVPVHNNKEDTEEFLQSLKKVTYPNYKVILVDDGSTDGTAEMIKERYPYVILLKGDGNLWWSRATNIGIEKAIEIGADYVLMIDNDTVVDSEFISPLVDVTEKNPRTITTSKCYYYYRPKIITHIGWRRVGWLKGSFGFKLIGVNEMDNGQYDNIKEVEGATISVLVKAKFFDDIGMIDYQKFPQYFADLDFSYRAYKKGYKTKVVPESIIWHKCSSSIKKRLPEKTSFLRTFIYLISDKKSYHYFPTAMNFYLKHCPFYIFPLVFGLYFINLISVSLKHQMMPPTFLEGAKR